MSNESNLNASLQPSLVGVLIVAAGRGTRFGGDIPKQYRRCGPRPLLATTLQALHAALPDARLTTAIHPDDAELYREAVAGLPPDLLARLDPPALGGDSRQQSVANGLESLSKAALEVVLIHDAARPFAKPPLVARAAEAAQTYGAAAPGAPLVDTIVATDPNGNVGAALDRAQLRAMQTPQAFRFDLILAAHRSARDKGVDNLTDDAAVARLAGHAVHVFEGQADNFKVTTMDDFLRAEARLNALCDDVRVGQGFDVHAFTAGSQLWLGGIAIAHERALLGHSDADVALHALADAIYGALAEGDIGQHFPPSDPQWRGAASSVFLSHAAARVRARGGLIAHLDLTIVCEAPKIGPHREAMRERIAAIAELSPDRVAVKATTSERLGFTGRREGIAAFATATVRLPSVRAD
jgi:2-C-methyl-D-erythritol 4-phosphate cytidylyltransferase/2-C-methyl-D-erythritol 2,4-cyclodiphosphate synthase